LQSPPLHLFVDAQFTSPFAMSVYVALQEKQLDFEMSVVDLNANENAAPAYAAISATRRVPTLTHGRFSLSESSAITEYLEDVFPHARLYPADPELRARARQVQAWLRSDLLPLRQERPTEVVFYQSRKPPLSPAAQAAAHKFVAATEALLPDGAEHLCGTWSIADCDLAMMLNRLAMHGDPLPARLREYAERQWARPAIQRWMRMNRPPA